MRVKDAALPRRLSSLAGTVRSSVGSRGQVLYLCKDIKMMNDSLTTATILSNFTEQIQSHGGRVTECFEGDRCLFVRSLLPYVANARPKDRLEGGVGLRVTDSDIWLHPYLFRQVCRNGAIMAQSLHSMHLENLDLYSPKIAVSLLREAVEECSAEHVFAQSMQQVRSSIDTAADQMLNMLPHLRHFQQAGMERFVPQIIREFFVAGDRSRYGLMNAVTATARDERDPEDRWRLEELGGDIGAGILPRHPSNAPGRQLSQPRPLPVA
jgi:hypothetical protein